jgi:hypothetical protein
MKLNTHSMANVSISEAYFESNYHQSACLYIYPFYRCKATSSLFQILDCNRRPRLMKTWALILTKQMSSRGGSLMATTQKRQYWSVWVNEFLFGSTETFSVIAEFISFTQISAAPWGGILSSYTSASYEQPSRKPLTYCFFLQRHSLGGLKNRERNIFDLTVTNIRYKYKYPCLRQFSEILWWFVGLYTANILDSFKRSTY